MMNAAAHTRDTTARKLYGGCGRQGSADKRKGETFQHTGTASHNMGNCRRVPTRPTGTQGVRARIAGGIRQTIGDSRKNKGSVS